MMDTPLRNHEKRMAKTWSTKFIIFYVWRKSYFSTSKPLKQSQTVGRRQFLRDSTFNAQKSETIKKISRIKRRMKSKIFLPDASCFFPHRIHRPTSLFSRMLYRAVAHNFTTHLMCLQQPHRILHERKREMERSSSSKKKNMGARCIPYYHLIRRDVIKQICTQLPLKCVQSKMKTKKSSSSNETWDAFLKVSIYLPICGCRYHARCTGCCRVKWGRRLCLFFQEMAKEWAN